jgi:hypothetical protein
LLPAEAEASSAARRGPDTRQGSGSRRSRSGAASNSGRARHERRGRIDPRCERSEQLQQARAPRRRDQVARRWP